MSNLTLTINLDSLTPTQLAALQVIVLAGGAAGGNERRAVLVAIDKAGFANCGDNFLPTCQEVADFLNGKGAK